MILQSLLHIFITSDINNYAGNCIKNEFCCPTVQLDNARPHVGKDNIQILNDFGDTMTPEITIICQPPQSPEVNVNDLGSVSYTHLTLPTTPYV